MRKGDHFDQVAKGWSSDSTVRRNQALGRAVGEHLPEKVGRLLDFGCGTGLLSRELLGRCEQLVGVDTSGGMIEEFRSHFTAAHHVQGHVLNLEEGSWPVELGDFDIVVTAMAFHHLRGPQLMLQRFAKHLRPGGKVFVIDVDAEDGSFHPDNHGMGVHHHGFSLDALRSWTRAAGFREFQYEIVYHIEKNDRRYGVAMAVYS